MGLPTKKSGTPDDTQFQLFVELPQGGRLGRSAAESGRKFMTGNPHAIVIGTTPLEQYLRESGQTEPFTVAELLDAQDWTEFEARYAHTGRPPYAPRLMLGLILYGVMQGTHSLRELERLARLDVGCMWITGGIWPDHANIGRFITLHEQSLTSSFFEALTRHVLKRTGSNSDRLAGDGTVIEAACSHYNRLREEAVRERLKKAEAALEQDPDSAAVNREHQTSKRCVEVYEERAEARQRNSRPTDTLSVSPTEPDAMFQRVKRTKGFAFSHKPSLLANKNRIITAVALDPSSETKSVLPLLEQSARVLGRNPKEVLLDAGYFDDGVIAATLERDISLLCPDGQTPGQAKRGKVFSKAEFDYQPTDDTYRCPAGQTLVFIKAYAPTDTKAAERGYGTSACAACSIKSQCTSLKSRKIRRLAEDDARDALREVMRHPQAKEIFRQRKAMVEPVFSHLRGRQGLHRFRRRGMAAVMREFALHAIAHNLSRAVALLRAFYRASGRDISASRTFYAAIMNRLGFLPRFESLFAGVALRYR